MERLQVFINGKRALKMSVNNENKGGTKTMKKSNIVASYDYYSPQQVEKFIAEAIHLERKRVAYKKRMNRKQNMSAFFGGLMMMIFIFGMITFYIKFGYII